MKILSQADLVARSLGAYLARHPEFDDRGGACPPQFFTSGDPEAISRLGSQFYGRPVVFRNIAEALAPERLPQQRLVGQSA